MLRISYKYFACNPLLLLLTFFMIISIQIYVNIVTANRSEDKNLNFKIKFYNLKR